SPQRPRRQRRSRPRRRPPVGHRNCSRTRRRTCRATRQQTAIVYGAGGAIGSAVSRAYAREGARVFLAGRTAAPLDRVASVILSAGGAAEVATVDVLEQASVLAHTSSVAATSGGIDIVFNATSNDDVQGAALVDMTFEDFM